MQFKYIVSFKLLPSLSTEEGLKEEQKEFSGADPIENRKAAFGFFQQKLKENSAEEPSPVNITSHSSKALVVYLNIYKEEEHLHTLTLYETPATERDLLGPAQKELGFYKQYAVNLPEDSINNTLLVIVPRFTSQIVQ